MRTQRGAAIVITLLLMAGCITSYKPEIQQGNVVTQEMVEKLKPGMTKSQVRFVLGTPLIADRFHPERWDYIYVYKKNVGAPAETRQFTVIFDGDALTRTEGDFSMPPSATASDGPVDGNVSPQSADSLLPARAL